MTINLDFGRHHNYNVSESRISLMLEKDKKSATQLNLWERFKDLFRTNKKSDAYNELYNLLHCAKGCDKFDSFDRLKCFAKPENQTLFTKEIHNSGIVFLINNKQVGESSIQKLIRVSEQTPLPRMSRPEQQLFLDMLDTYREKKQSASQLQPSQIRALISDQHCFDVMSLYRPNEENDHQGSESIIPQVISNEDSRALECLNPGGNISLNIFASMGYQKTSSGVEFNMMHPLMN